MPRKIRSSDLVKHPGAMPRVPRWWTTHAPVDVADVNEIAAYVRDANRNPKTGKSLYFGYFGSSARSAVSDDHLAQAARKGKITMADVLLWGNSSCARHFMDNFGRRLPPSAAQFEEEINRALDWMYRESFARRPEKAA